MSHKRRVIPKNLPISCYLLDNAPFVVSALHKSPSSKRIKIHDSISLHVKINIKSAVEWSDFVFKF